MGNRHPEIWNSISAALIDGPGGAKRDAAQGIVLGIVASTSLWLICVIAVQHAI